MSAMMKQMVIQEMTSKFRKLELGLPADGVVIMRAAEDGCFIYPIY